MKQISYDFPSMDTLVEVKAFAEQFQEPFVTAFKSLPNWFDLIEETVSRFSPDSELNKLNKSNGDTLQVSPLLFILIEQAMAAAQKTSGIFDPTVLNSLVQSGYDRTFGELAIGSGNSKRTKSRKVIPNRISPINPPQAANANNGFTKLLHQNFREIKIDPFKFTVTLPSGLGIDLGGIAKGWAVDQAMEYVQKWENDTEICINAGGDLRLHVPKGREPWEIAVQNPFKRDRDIGFIKLNSGAAATSSVLKRRWQNEGSIRHHLIDPRLGLPSQSAIVAATVVASKAAEAEVWTKALCILGQSEGFDLLAQQAGLAALGVLKDGTLIMNKEMEKLFDAADTYYSIEIYD